MALVHSSKQGTDTLEQEYELYFTSSCHINHVATGTQIDTFNFGPQ